MVVRFSVEFDTPVAPERIVSAMTDFSDRRPDLWPMLAPSLYAVHSVGQNTADVTEGSTRPFEVWAREAYTWSHPNMVRWEVTESNFSLPGHGHTLTVEQTDTGSHVRLDYDRGVYGAKGIAAGVMMKLFGRRIVRSYLQKTMAGWS
jgi:hypothetical protein